MGLFEQNLLLLIAVIIAIVEWWNACKRIFHRLVRFALREEERA